MPEVRIVVTDITDENRRDKFTAAVESLSKAMKLPLTVKPRAEERAEQFVFRSHEELVGRWNLFMGDALDAVYLTVCRALDLPVIRTFSKAIGEADPVQGRPAAEAIFYNGKVVFNPETGEPIYRDEFEKIIRSIERFMNRRLDPARKKIVLNAVSLGRILARRLETSPSTEIRKLGLGELQYNGKGYEWIEADLARQDKLFGPARPEERDRMKAHYRGLARFVEAAEQSMGENITRMEDDVRHAVSRAILDGVKGRRGKGEVAQDLFDRFGALNRDWQRIAETEVVETANNAMLRETAAMAAPGEKVYFRRVEMRDKFVCKYCERIRGVIALWSDHPLLNDEIEDPIATVAIWEGKNNVGRKAAEYWVPSGTVHPWCYSDDTEVLTDRGWMLFKDLAGGEKIMSMNPESREIGYVGYVDKIAYPYRGDMVHFQALNYDKLVTPNHQVLFTTPKMWKKKKLFSESASEVVKRSAYMLPMAIGEWQGTEPPETMMIGGVAVPFREYVRLWAWFLSEGNTRRREVKLSQKRTSKILNNLPSLKPLLREADGAVYLYGDPALLFSDFVGVHAESKYVPDFIKELPADYIKEFLASYNWGDGSYSVGARSDASFSENSSEMTIRTSSRRMMSDLCELIVKAGWIPSVWVHEQKGRVCSFRNGDYTLKTDCYNINIKKSKFRHFSSNPRMCPNGKMSHQPALVQYDGMVYDVELEKWHFLLVKRNGKVCWSGNCRGSWERYYPPVVKGKA